VIFASLSAVESSDCGLWGIATPSACCKLLRCFAVNRNKSLRNEPVEAAVVESGRGVAGCNGLARVDARDYTRNAEAMDSPNDPRFNFDADPSLDEIIAQQGKGPVNDLSTLHGGFWPEEESIEEFLAALDEWRGHKRADPAA
jgi:hypothetical protein